MNFVLDCFACGRVEAYEEGYFDAAREEEVENLLRCQLQHSVSVGLWS